MEQGRNGTACRRHCSCSGTLVLNLGEFIKTKLFSVRTAPAPKYLKMHYVKEEIGDGKGIFHSNIKSDVNHHFTGTQSWFLLPAAPETISLQQALHESVFSPGISVSPPHRVALCWDKHCQLLPEVLGLTAKRVATWSAEEVRHAYRVTLFQRMKTRRQKKKSFNPNSLLFFPSGGQFCQRTSRV